MSPSRIPSRAPTKIGDTLPPTAIHVYPLPCSVQGEWNFYYYNQQITWNESWGTNYFMSGTIAIAASGLWKGTYGNPPMSAYLYQSTDLRCPAQPCYRNDAWASFGAGYDLIAPWNNDTELRAIHYNSDDSYCCETNATNMRRGCQAPTR